MWLSYAKGKHHYGFYPQSWICDQAGERVDTQERERQGKLCLSP